MSGALSKVSRAGLSKYSPETGLKRMAGAEAAEKYYARAKDATGLQYAIRAKLEAQAEFVFWWDTKGPGSNHGGQRAKGRKQGNGSVTSLPDKMTISRWRKRLNDPVSFETTFEQAVARALAALKTPRLQYVAYNDLAQMGRAVERRTPILVNGIACGERIAYRRGRP